MFTVGSSDLDAFVFSIIFGWVVAVLKVWRHKRERG